ncbi:hypothetical protein PLA106_27816 [Pseudomonas amygdali pv. lachrymans str. M302278]|nr:hypothetical protein PLA106_27816 [Pseudomonas amygdali pv. lachrymans str. M302278]
MQLSRQARNQFCGDGLIGMCHAALATILFVQSLSKPPAAAKSF